MTAARRRAGGLAGRLVLAGLGLLVPLLAVELLLRVAGPILPGDYQTATFTSYSTAFGRQNRPYRGGYKHTSEFTTRVRVNSKRLRGPEIDYAKPPGTFRTVVLGDSFTFALQVDEEETFVARLGERLEQTTGADLHFETINAGTDGWSTVNEYVWFTAEGYRYEPDLVVLMFFVGNDPGENADQIRTIAPGGRLIPETGAGGTWAEIRLALSDLSMTYSFLEHGVLARLSAPPEPTTPRTSTSPGPRRTEAADRARKKRGWEVSEPLLRQLREFCDARGIRLAVVGIPTAEQVDDDGRPASPLREIAERADVPAIDLLEPFRASPRDLSQPIYFPKDRHWTAEGHDLGARIVAAELRQRHLVPGALR